MAGSPFIKFLLIDAVRRFLENYRRSSSNLEKLCCGLFFMIEIPGIYPDNGGRIIESAVAGASLQKNQQVPEALYAQSTPSVAATTIGLFGPVQHGIVLRARGL
ncbi:MAG: hypothetical protein M3H12_06060 [Chromatiales bacterium]